MKYLLPCFYILLSLTALHSVAQLNEPVTAATALHAIQQQYGLDPDSPLLSRITTTPDDVLKMFRDAGMSPTEHALTREELSLVSRALATLPPLHQRILQQHLKSISFLDNMPNTALTSPVTKEEGIKLYHITFRSGILHQTIGDWATEKERTCYAKGDSSISVSIEGGLLDAFTYVLLHEGTHVVDGSLHLIAADTVAGQPTPNAFTARFSKGIWKNINTIVWSFTDTLVPRSRFRPGGRLLLATEAPKVYKGLSQTPFVSLYSTTSWHEDLAELLTIYHLTKKYKQPFRIIVKQHGKVIRQYEPMKSALVQKRLPLLNYFYTKA